MYVICPRASLGVDIEKGFTPEYVVPPGKRKIIGEIKEAIGKARSIYLATDPDREGEAISWHLVQATKLDKNDRPIHRVVFHEITEDAVQEAFRSPRSIDMNLVNAQQARRILDRLVGYKLSPLLWRKVQRGLSAGRVQSVAVRMIVDREQEIQDFAPQEYWIMEVELAPLEDKKAAFRARLFALADGTKLGIGSKDEADRVIADLEKAEYAVKTVVTKQVARQPAPPFHHQHPAARGLAEAALHSLANHGYCTATLRRLAPGQGRFGGTYHLYAHRFHPRGCLRHNGSKGIHRREIRSQISPAKATEFCQESKVGPGSSRGNSGPPKFTDSRSNSNHFSTWPS